MRACFFFSFHHSKYEQRPSSWKLAEICCVIYFFWIFLHHTIHNCGVVLNQGISAHCGRISTDGTGKLAITKRPSNNTVHQPCEGYQRQKRKVQQNATKTQRMTQERNVNKHNHTTVSHHIELLRFVCFIPHNSFVIGNGWNIYVFTTYSISLIEMEYTVTGLYNTCVLSNLTVGVAAKK